MISPNVILILSLGLIGLGGFLIFTLNRKSNAQTENLKATDNFVKEVGVVLSEVFPETRFEYKSDIDTYVPLPKANASESSESPDGMTLFLGNLRNRTQDMGSADRKVFLRDFLIQVTSQTDLTPELIKETLFMRCRTPEEFATRECLMGAKDMEKPFEPIIIAKGEMQFEPVLNMDDAVQTMNAENMREAGFAFDEFIQLAGKNLLSVTPPNSPDHWEKLEADIWISKLNDDFDAARVFLFPEELSFPFTETPIVYAPSHAICLITSKTDEATLKRLIELGDESSQTHRPLSRALWQLVEGNWRRMMSQDRNSAAGRSRFIETINSYDDQKNALEQLFEATERDIHVAAVIVRDKSKEDEPDQLETLSVFIGHHSYLPKTDFVVLGFEDAKIDKTIREVPWDVFANIIGEENLISHPDLKPVRYMFGDPISDDKIQALLKAAIKI